MYKKGNYIAFMTKQPEVHLNVMFGYNDLTEADFEKTEHIGFILSVIDDKTYLVMTVRPLEGFRCIVDNADILHLVKRSRGRFLGSWGSVLLIIFYIENLDVGSWGVKNDVYYSNFKK